MRKARSRVVNATFTERKRWGYMKYTHIGLGVFIWEKEKIEMK